MKRTEMKINGSTLSIETGKVARQSAGSVIVTHGETTVLVAVNAAKDVREDVDFFPLQVEYREKHYASGKHLKKAKESRPLNEVEKLREETLQKRF